MTKHIFIVNPAAGKGIEARPLTDKIRDGCEVSGVDFTVYQTTRRGDATEYVRRLSARKPHEDEYRFYACGGDGTLSEVINGVVDEGRRGPLPGIHVGCVPIGTGNDFVRNFKQYEFFSDITKQLLGDPIVIDCFALNDRYGINMFNVGFDCDVVCKAAELKKQPLMPKRLAYVAGVALVLIKNAGKVISVHRADGSEITREFELCAVANGGFCGGGFYSAPESRLDDGLLDISLIKKVSRSTFLALVGSYKKGTHLGTRLGKKVVAYSKERSIAFRFSEDTAVSIDGEIETVREAVFRSVPGSVSFVLPVGVEYPPVV